MNNLLYGQSGGPTSVINSSGYGVFKAALKNKNIDKCYAGYFGIEGILQRNLFLIEKSNFISDSSLLKQTPGSAFGSCRHNLKDYKDDESEYQEIIKIFKEYNIKYFLYNGGNDSMETVLKLSEYFKKVSFDCCVLGIPKTIDNDLKETDHTPGFGSASKYIANTILSVEYDCLSYEKGRVNVFEIMGRDTGWLTCASSLASLNGYGPDLVYIPEYAFDIDEFILDVKRIYQEKGHCFVAVSEGIKDKDGVFLLEHSKKQSKDNFGHTQLGGVGNYLCSLLSNEGIKTRCIELNLPQRGNTFLTSDVDLKEAELCGEKAVEFIINKNTGLMVSLNRVTNKKEADYFNSKINYGVKCSLVDINKVGGQVKYVPFSFYDNKKHLPTKEFISYAKPLIYGEIKIKTENGLLKVFEDRRSKLK